LTEKVEKGLNLETEQREYSVIALDGTFVECGSRTTHVLVVVDAYRRQPIWFTFLINKNHTKALRFLQRLRKGCLCDPFILTDKGPW